VTAVKKLKKMNARKESDMTRMMWFIAIFALLGALGGWIFG
jgi:hypothetical protein